MAGEPGQRAGLLVMLTGDEIIARRLRQLARENGLVPARPGPGDDVAAPEAAEPEEAGPAAVPPEAVLPEGTEPEVAVIDLRVPDALERLRDWRARWPAALLAGFVSEPDPQRWLAAQRTGADLVVNRGALVPQLRSRLGRRAGVAARDRRYPLLASADVAGRLGLVYATGESPVGPLAVYQVDGRLHAVADRCPHAGAALSGGEVESGVVTCPRHGSRFDVRTGERVRGPADTGIPCYQVTREGGQVVLILPG